MSICFKCMREKHHRTQSPISPSQFHHHFHHHTIHVWVYLRTNLPYDFNKIHVGKYPTNPLDPSWDHHFHAIFPNVQKGKKPFLVANDDGAFVEDAPEDAEELGEMTDPWDEPFIYLHELVDFYSKLLG